MGQNKQIKENYNKVIRVFPKKQYNICLTRIGKEQTFTGSGI